MSSSYAAWNAGEVERVGVLDVRHEQRARAVALLQVDARPRFTCWWRTTTGLPSIDAVARVHARARRRARAAPRSAMRWVKLTLPPPRAREVVVEDLAVDLEQLGRDGAHRRRGRDAEARLHVLDDAGRGAAQRLRRLAVEHQRARSRPVRRRRRPERGCRRRGAGPAVRRSRCRGRPPSAAAGVVGEELAPVGVDRRPGSPGSAGRAPRPARRSGRDRRSGSRLPWSTPWPSLSELAHASCSRQRRQRRRSSATWNARSSDWRALSRGSQLVS